MNVFLRRYLKLFIKTKKTKKSFDYFKYHSFSTNEHINSKKINENSNDNLNGILDINQSNDLKKKETDNLNKTIQEIKDFNKKLIKFRKIFSVNTVCLITEINKQINYEEIEFKKSFNTSYKRILFEQGYNKIEMQSNESIKIFRKVEMFDIEITIYKYVLNEDAKVMNDLIEQSQKDIIFDEMNFIHNAIGTSLTYEDRNNMCKINIM